MKRIILLLLASLISLSCRSNMASPILIGSTVGEPFIAQNVEILQENIYITLDSSFQLATYHIRYELKAMSTSNDVPMLFYAPEIHSNFSVLLDGKSVPLMPFSAYSSDKVAIEQYFEPYYADNKENADVEIPLGLDNSEKTSISISELKYFLMNFDKPTHIVDVYYDAKPYIDKRGWVKKYIFRYSLAPARYWKSFGDLNIHLDATQFRETISTNIIAETFSGDSQERASWTMHDLPKDEMILINYVPSVSALAKWMIRISPFGFAVILAAFMVFIHLFIISNYRKSQSKGFLWIKVFGIILIPIIVYISMLLFYDLTYKAIGIHAAKSQGYGLVFLIILVPIAMLGYGMIVFLWDYFMQKKYLQ
jgi:hypothetical protein